MIKIIEARKFPETVKKYFEKNVNNCKVGIKYIDAKLVSFEKCNLKYISAYRIIVYGNNRILEVLYVGKDADNQKMFYLNSLANPTTIKEIARIVHEMA